MRKDGVKSCEMDVEIYGTRRNLKSIINFQKHVGFNNDRKRKRLEDYIQVLSSPLPSEPL